MSKLIIAALVAASLTVIPSCAPRMPARRYPGAAEITRALAGFMARHGFTVQAADYDVLIVNDAPSMPPVCSGERVSHRWSFGVSGGELYVTSSLDSLVCDQDGNLIKCTLTPIGDSAPRAAAPWYWAIRDSIESVSGARVRSATGMR